MLDPRLKYLVAVARAGSFTAGAAAVGITQSAVTKSVADLEREVGYPIFERTTRGVVLTERGSYFAERAAMLLEATRDLFDPDARRPNLYSGVLRVGVAPASLEWTVVEAIVRLRKQHPAIKFELTGSGFERMIQQLRSGAIDVAIGLDAALSDWPDVNRTVFGALHTAPFVRRDHPLAREANPTLADLARYDFVSPSISRPHGEVIRDVYTARGVAWQSRVHVIDYFPAVKRLILTSDAIGVVAASYVTQPGFTERFAALSKLDLFPAAPLASAVRAQWEPKPIVRAFLSALRAAQPRSMAISAGNDRVEKALDRAR